MNFKSFWHLIFQIFIAVQQQQNCCALEIVVNKHSCKVRKVSKYQIRCNYPGMV